MDSTIESAYRHLLYVVMLRIRNRSELSRYASANPFIWLKYYRQSMVNGALADWLHNVANYSVLGFDRFEEERFWQEHQDLCKRFPNQGLERYREIFQSYIKGQVYIC